MHQCRQSGGPDWLFGLALDLGALALISVAMWAAVRRGPSPTARDRRPRRVSRLREWIRRTTGLVVSVVLLGHWLLGFSHVGSVRFAILGGSGLAVLLPLVAVIRLDATARRQRPTPATPMPWSAVRGPVRWALPALATVGTLGCAAALGLREALAGSC